MQKMFKIGELAKETGLHVNTIRRLENDGVIQADRTLSGYRIFSEDAIEQLRTHYSKVEGKK